MLMAVSKTKGRVNGLQAMVGDPGEKTSETTSLRHKGKG
jgi:hypothetical protein